MKQPRSDSTSPREGGQALVLFVLALAALLGFMALAIDVGQAMVEKRSAQNAVDAAALAGAAYLPNHDNAVAKANQWLTLNGYTPGDGNTVTITTPYNGDPNKIEVRLSNSVGPSFAGAVGFAGFNITARSVGKRNINPYAIFQTGPNPSGDDDDDDPECDGELELEGDNFFIAGSTHADGEFEIEGDNLEITGAVTYVCEFESEGTNLTFGSGPTQLPAPVPPPVSFEYSDFATCTFSVSGNLRISNSTPQYFVNNNVSSGQLKPGVYCATGDIKLDENISASQISGNVTFVAHGEIEMEHNNLNLTAYRLDVLAFTDGCEDEDDDDGDPGENPGDPGDTDGDAGEGEIELEADNLTFSGMLIAACGEVEVEGDSVFSPSTLILGQEVELEGEDGSITAGNYTVGGPHLAE